MPPKTAIAIPDLARKKANASIRRYVSENLDEEIGEMKADFLLGYFLAELGPVIYNQAIADARTFFEERTADLGAVCYQNEFGYWNTPGKKG